MPLTLMTWNVNGLRSVFKPPPPPPQAPRGPTPARDAVPDTLPVFLRTHACDVLCLQETKLSLPLAAHLVHVPGHASFHAVCPQPRGYSGVATYVREGLTRSACTGEAVVHDHEGRAVVTDLGEFVLVNLYCPNGGRSMAYKFEFYKALIRYVEELIDLQRQVILCGDFNIVLMVEGRILHAHHPIDLWNPKDMASHTGFTQAERALLDTFTTLGLVDAFRVLHPQSQRYTFWDTRTQQRARDRGWRIDTFWVTRPLVPRVRSVEILHAVFGSDHCPVQLVLDGEFDATWPTPTTAANLQFPKQPTLHTFFASGTAKRRKVVEEADAPEDRA